MRCYSPNSTWPDPFATASKKKNIFFSLMQGIRTFNVFSESSLEPCSTIVTIDAALDDEVRTLMADGQGWEEAESSSSSKEEERRDLGHNSFFLSAFFIFFSLCIIFLFLLPSFYTFFGWWCLKIHVGELKMRKLLELFPPLRMRCKCGWLNTFQSIAKRSSIIIIRWDSKISKSIMRVRFVSSRSRCIPLWIECMKTIKI